MLYKLHDLGAKTSNFPKSKKKKELLYRSKAIVSAGYWMVAVSLLQQSTEGAHVTKPNNNFLTECCMLLESQQNREKKKK